MHNKSVVSQNTAYKYNVGNKQKIFGEIHNIRY